MKISDFPTDNKFSSKNTGVSLKEKITLLEEKVVFLHFKKNLK